MSAILYPVAHSAEAALSRPLGRAARAKEAQAAAGGPVDFRSEPAGPAFPTREAALDAYAGRLEDDRPGRLTTLAPEDRFLRLIQVAAPAPDGAARGRARLPGPVRPAFQDGRRWPAPQAAPATAWRVTVSYWKLVSAEEAADLPQARKARRDAAGPELDRDRLRALAGQPLRATRPQQPLDIGLFERRLPENPDIVVPDE